MYIRGIGRTKFGVLRESLDELMLSAIDRALQDARLFAADIDAIYVSNFLGEQAASQLHLGSVVSGFFPGLYLPAIRIEAACASGGAAFYQGSLTLDTHANVLIVGAEKMSEMGTKAAATAIAMTGDRVLDQAQGLIFPASYALIAQQHMLEFGTTIEDLDLVSLKNHRNANLNEYAHFYHKQVDLEMIRNAPLVASPLTLFHCSPISDGAVALVLARDKLSQRDVKIKGSSLATDAISLAQRETAIGFPAARAAARAAYEQSGVGPLDIDIFQVHDCFSIAEITAMEDLGICETGGGAELVRESRTTLTGDIPVNTDGGLKANGHPIGASGLAQIYETVGQIRGEAGARQVPGVNLGLTHNIGGVGGTAVVTILEKCGA